MMKTQPVMQGESATATALIVEDDEQMCALLKSLAINIGYKQVFAVRRMEPAFQRLEYGSFSIAIIDLNLGAQDGVSLISAIRSNPRRCVSAMPVLVASTAATGQRIQAALLAGADGFLCKPFTISNLQRQIRFSHTKAQSRLNRLSDHPPTPPALAQPVLDVIVLD